MKAYLETTIVKFKDLSEQPVSKYVMLLQGTNVVPQVSIALDTIVTDDHFLRGFLNGEAEPRIILPVGAIEFAVFDRQTFEEITRETAIRMTADQINALKELRKELDPEAANDEEMMRAVEHSHLAELAKGVKLAEGNGDKKGLGQYL